MTALRVLVVDGEPQLVRGLTIVLRGGGYVVEAVRTASEVLAGVVDHPPDALLLDTANRSGGAPLVARSDGRHGQDRRTGRTMVRHPPRAGRLCDPTPAQ